jgi:hypothetical protein
MNWQQLSNQAEPPWPSACGLEAIVALTRMFLHVKVIDHSVEAL